MIEDEAEKSDTLSSPNPSSEIPLPASPGGTIKANFLNTMSKVFKAGGPGGSTPLNAGGVWKEPQPWEILKAIERKDIMFLMEVRDRAFHVSDEGSDSTACSLAWTLTLVAVAS